MNIPFNYTPRTYQEPFWRYMLEGGRRAYLVWHRRGGKDKTIWNWLITSATLMRPGQYYYFFPTYAQGKKILWDGQDYEGMPFLDHVPPSLILNRNETEMQVTVQHLGPKRGHSTIQIIGTDHIESIKGTNPVGAVFSEFAFQNPRAWDLVEPILLENKGWSVFVTTPYGDNHAAHLWRAVQGNPSWFTSLLTIRDTQRPDGSPVIAEAQIEELRRRGVDERLIQAEYYCSFEGALLGAYFADQLALAEKDGRIGKVPWETALPVETSWDLGIGDATAIWFSQTLGREIRFIDFLQASGEGLSFFVKHLRDRPYIYTFEHLAPHDVEIRELTTGVSRKETALAQYGLRFRTIPKLPKDEQIDAARRVFSRCYFDAEKCQEGLNALRNYRKEYDHKRQSFRLTPFHDWSSDAADAFQVFAVGHRDRVDRGPIQVETNFNVWDYELQPAPREYAREFNPLRDPG